MCAPRCFSQKEKDRNYKSINYLLTNAYICLKIELFVSIFKLLMGEKYEIWATLSQKCGPRDVLQHRLVGDGLSLSEAISSCKNSQTNQRIGQKTTYFYYRSPDAPSFAINVEAPPDTLSDNVVSSIFEVLYDENIALERAADYREKHNKHLTGCNVSIIKIDEMEDRRRAEVSRGGDYGSYRDMRDNETGDNGTGDNETGDNETICDCQYCGGQCADTTDTDDDVECGGEDVGGGGGNGGCGNGVGGNGGCGNGGGGNESVSTGANLSGRSRVIDPFVIEYLRQVRNGTSETFAQELGTTGEIVEQMVVNYLVLTLNTMV